MKKLLATLFFFLFFFTLHALPFPLASSAQQLGNSSTNDRYFKGEVVKVVSQDSKEIAGYDNFVQKLEVKLTEGQEKGKIVTVENGGMIKITAIQRLTKGDEVIILQSTTNNKTTYSLFDRFRLNSILFIALFFFVLVIGIAGKKGFGAIIGMLVSLLVILKFIVPQILGGNDPLFIAIIGSTVIMLITLYLAHGFSQKTHIALLATILSLSLTGIISVLAVALTRLSGLGDENTYLLQFGQTQINLQGILLGGMIIGALGVLDDITTAQSAAIFELHSLNEKLKFSELFKKGMNIGKEHIASLVNTLVLAYAGAALGIFILLELNPAHQPLWVMINSEVITEEIVRTLTGSIGIVLAVPITTLLAVIACKYKIKFT